MKKLILSIYVLALSCESPKHENQKPETEELFNCLSDSVQVVTISKDLPLLTTPELSELERLQMIPEKERKRLLKIGEINIFRSGEKLEVFRDKNGQKYIKKNGKEYYLNGNFYRFNFSMAGKFQPTDGKEYYLKADNFTASSLEGVKELDLIYKTSDFGPNILRYYKNQLHEMSVNGQIKYVGRKIRFKAYFIGDSKEYGYFLGADNEKNYFLTRKACF